MSILLIGSGLIGSQIARLELERGESVVVLDLSPRLDALGEILEVRKVKIVQGDVLNPHDLYDVIRSQEVTRVIHAAANPLLTAGAQIHPYEAVRLNIMGTLNVLEVARRMNLDRVVFTSSGVIQHYSTEGPDGWRRPTTIYATTKLACENLGFNYMDSYGLDFVALRFAAVIGPWRYGGGGGPTQKIKEMLEKSIRGEPVVLPGEAPEYVYSKDAAKACVLACHASRDPLKRRVYNVGMGKVYMPEEVKKMVEKILPKAQIEIKGGPSAGVAMTQKLVPLDIKVSEVELGYKPDYDMQGALNDYVAWIRATQKV